MSNIVQLKCPKCGTIHTFHKNYEKKWSIPKYCDMDGVKLIRLESGSEEP